MRFLLGVLFILILPIPPNVEAQAYDPRADEVALQTWYGKIPQTKRMHFCDTKNAKAIVKKYNKKATPKGKKHLVKAYKNLMTNC